MTSNEQYIYAIYRWSSEKMLNGLVEAYDEREDAQKKIEELMHDIPEDDFELLMCRYIPKGGN